MSPTSIPAALGREESTTPQIQVPDKGSLDSKGLHQALRKVPRPQVIPSRPATQAHRSQGDKGPFGGHREEGK